MSDRVRGLVGGVGEVRTGWRVGGGGRVGWESGSRVVELCR